MPRSRLVASLLFLALQEAHAGGSRCREVETPAAPGAPHIVIPAGIVPHTGPLEIADLARGDRRELVVTCVELLERGLFGTPSWVLHLEAPFSVIVSGAHGSCSADHQLLTFDDETRALESRQGIGQRCRMQPHRLTRGR